MSTVWLAVPAIKSHFTVNIYEQNPMQVHVFLSFIRINDIYFILSSIQPQEISFESHKNLENIDFDYFIKINCLTSTVSGKLKHDLHL